MHKNKNATGDHLLPNTWGLLPAISDKIKLNYNGLPVNTMKLKQRAVVTEALPHAKWSIIAKALIGYSWGGGQVIFFCRIDTGKFPSSTRWPQFKFMQATITKPIKKKYM